MLFLLSGLSESIGISILLPVLNIDKAVSDQGQYTKIVYNFLESKGINISLFPFKMFRVEGEYMVPCTDVLSDYEYAKKLLHDSKFKQVLDYLG